MEDEIKIIYERTRKRYRHEDSEKGEKRIKKMREGKVKNLKKDQKLKLQKRNGTKIYAKTNQRN